MPDIIETIERANNLYELHERAWPPMRKNDGYGVGMRGPCVDEVNTKPVTGRRVCLSIRPEHSLSAGGIGMTGGAWKRVPTRFRIFGHESKGSWLGATGDRARNLSKASMWLWCEMVASR
jgi:hypothetical protein